jgi:hypothetical protein
VIIVVVEVGAVKICVVVAVDSLMKKERGDETEVHHQNWWKN